jgi:serine/threonine protein phosphatase PrpC
MAATTQSVLLLGPDHPQLRDLAVGGLPAAPADGTLRSVCTLGAALSAGWMPKVVPAAEPNEDGVLVALGPAGALLAVADGHNGSAASAAALRALADRVPDLLGAPGPPGRAGAPLDGAGRAAAFAAAAQAAATVPSGARASAAAGLPGRPAPPARTALSLAVVTTREIFAVGFGDSIVGVVRYGRLRTVGHPSEFLGPGLAADPLPGHPVTRLRRWPGDALLLTTDGVPDFLGRAFPAVAAEVTRAEPGRAAAAAARELVSRSGRAGAGDNLAAAVLLDAGPRRWPLRQRR